MKEKVAGSREQGAGEYFFIFPARCTLHAAPLRFLFYAVCLLLLFASSLHAMPLNPDAYKKLKGTAKLGVIENMLKAAPPTLNKPSAQKFSTITGTRKILVILVDFPDNVGATPSANYNQMLFSTGTYTTGSMRDYYREVSYGKFDINGTVTTKWYRAPQPYSYYVNQLAGIYGAYPNNAQKLVEDIVKLADADIDFSTYDSNGDGYVDGLFIVHAGGGAEADGNYGKIWAHKWTTNAPVSVDGVKVFDYTMEPEDGNIGVFCHEYGHELGLWDFYDTTNTGYGIGDYSVMGTGAWNNGAKTPAQFDAWSKIQLGWVTPVTPTTNQLSASIPQVETNATIYKLWTNGDSTSKEYFLAENRQKTGFDAYLPGSGLLVYHVDDNILGDNTPSPHYHVAVMQADGLKHLENKVNKGDAGDYFPGSTGNKNFNGTTTPNSKSYAGTDTYVAVNNISASGATMTADIYVSSGDTSAPSCTVLSLPEYTNTASFTVAWSAADTGNPASGVKTMDVQYRVGAGGTWTDWFTGTTAAQAVYTGVEGQTIYFQCRAIDNAGNQGSYSSAVPTILDFTPPAASITPLSATQVTAAFTVSWSGSDSLSGVKTYDVEYADAADGVWKNNWVQAGTTLTSATFAGTDGHTYYFRIRATDIAGNTGSFTSASKGDAQTIVAVDSTPPVISNVKVTNITTSSATITWTTDEDSDSQVKYAVAPNLTIQFAADIKTVQDSTLTKSHQITLSALFSGNHYEFRIKSKDSAGNTSSSYSSSFITLYGFTVTIPQGLSMVSFPIIPLDKNAGNIFSNANLKFARYDASVPLAKYHYYKDDPNDSYLEIVPGRGFWVKMDSEKKVSIMGTGSGYSVDLVPGWNQVGIPFPSFIDVDSIEVNYKNETISFGEANKKGWLANYFWSYENESVGYKLLYAGLTTSTLEPGKGYWFYAAVPCSLVFTRFVGIKAKGSVSLEYQSGLVQFTLSSSSGSDTENYAGFANDNMKISDPPPALEENGKPELLLKSSAADGAHYALVAKKKNYGEETFYLSSSGKDGEQGALSWSFNAAEFAEAMLVDVSNGKEISLLNEKQITLALTNEPKQFVVKLKLKAPSAEAAAENGGKPKILSAMNFPNPDRIGNATFRYNVSGDVLRVLIEVYTLTGKKISSLEGDLSGETKWLFGDTLPSGVYIYRITAFSPDGKDSVVRKMVVLK